MRRARDRRALVVRHARRARLERRAQDPRSRLAPVGEDATQRRARARAHDVPTNARLDARRVAVSRRARARARARGARRARRVGAPRPRATARATPRAPSVASSLARARRMPTATLATLARRLARAGRDDGRARRAGAHALALRATRVESSARANDALVARDEDVVTLTLQARPDARADVAGLLATLRPRDWTLLEHASTSRASFASAPSALVRKANGALVARLGPTTTLVGPRCAYVFEPATSVAKNIVDGLRTWVSERGAEEGAEARTVKDFPLAALECALEASSRYFEEKIFRLRRLARHCVDEISSDLRGDGKGGIVSGGSLHYSAAQWQKLPPIRRAIKEFEQDAREVSDALNAAMATTNLLPATHR